MYSCHTEPSIGSHAVCIFIVLYVLKKVCLKVAGCIVADAQQNLPWDKMGATAVRHEQEDSEIKLGVNV